MDVVERPRRRHPPRGTREAAMAAMAAFAKSWQNE
jgi:hypothetical protein